MKKLLSILLIIAVSSFYAQNNLKPLIPAQDQNLQNVYPEIQSSQQNKTSGCWTSLDASYIDLTSLFSGSYSALDDGSYGAVSLPFTFTFYGQTYTSLYINVNGNITFGAPYSTYSASGFPSASVPAMIAPFWGDVDLRGSSTGTNKAYYKLESNKITVVWVEVGYYNQNIDLVNSFQVVLTDGTDPDVGIGLNARFSYDDMDWCVGDASGGTNGFGTNMFATVGAQTQGGTNYYQIGLFGMDDSSYDGAGGNLDGVHYLDGQCFDMDLSGLNVPPIATDFPSSETLNICVGTTFSLNTGFIGPEISQTVVTTVTNSTLNSFSANITNGNYATQAIEIVPSILDTGVIHTITYEAIDNGAMPDTTIVVLSINVYQCSGIKDQSSLAFDGIDDYVISVNNSSYNPTSSITVESWVRPSANQTGENPIVYKDEQYSLYTDGATNTPKFKIYSGGVWNTISAGVDLTPDEWSHIAGSYNGAELKIYVNGELSNTSVLTGDIASSNNELSIGGEGTSLSYFSGRIDEVRIWGLERVQNEINVERYGQIDRQQTGLRAIFYLDEKKGAVAIDSANILSASLTNMDTTVAWKNNFAEIWNGSFSADFNERNNWNSGLVPGVTNSGSIELVEIVILPEMVSGSNLDLTTVEEVNNLVVYTAATPTISASGEMIIYKDFTNFGNPVHNGTVSLNGIVTQYVSGSNSFNNLNIDADIVLKNDQDIWGVLTLNTGGLDVNGNILTLKSDSVKTGSVFHNSGNIIGDVTLERFVNHSSSNWFGYHYFCAPIENVTLAQIDDDLTLKGLGGNVSSSPFPNIWYYDETVVSTDFLDGWLVPNDVTDNMVTMKGYALSMYNDFKLDFIGTLNSGNYSIPVTRTSSGNENADGWNFVGNPYPSAIDWDNVTLPSGIDNAVYFWDESIVQYASYVDGVGVNEGTKYISSSQGFYIHATSNATFSLTNACRTVGGDNGEFWKTGGQVDFTETIKLKLMGEGYQDELAIRFLAASTLNFDPEFDAYKVESGDPNAPVFCTEVNGDKVSINSLDSLDGTRSEPLFFETSLSGNYTIEISQKGYFDPSFTIELEDTKTGIFHNLETEGAYSFTYLIADNVNRFILHFNNYITGVSESSNETVKISSYQNKVSLTGLNNQKADVKILDMMGRETHLSSFSNEYSKEIQLPQSANGYYLIQLNINGTLITEKVFINHH